MNTDERGEAQVHIVDERKSSALTFSSTTTMAANLPSTASVEAPFSAEKYFATQPPPPNLEADVQNVRSFVQRHAQAGRRVVLVTVSPPLGPSPESKYLKIECSYRAGVQLYH